MTEHARLIAAAQMTVHEHQHAKLIDATCKLLDAAERAVSPEDFAALARDAEHVARLAAELRDAL